MESIKFHSIILIILLLSILVIVKPVKPQKSNKTNIKASTKMDSKIYNKTLKSTTFKETEEVWIGKAGSEPINATFTTNTMTYKENTYRSRWKEKDYCLIQIQENEIFIVGTHRYGAKAGSLYYEENKPTETTLIKWEDHNDDIKVQLDEIEKIRTNIKTMELKAVLNSIHS